MKFYRGKKQKYNAELHSDGIYFAHEDNNSSTIIANDHEFGTNYTEVTWQELKDLRDSSKLIPGSLYRITDYLCTTTQENTKSAGHQFDIVLLALSENKLAEEGWAMMNESNIYDVTFGDGVTKKCWLYYQGDDLYNIVLVDSLIGVVQDVEAFTINEVNKTIQLEVLSTDVEVENLTYNYFQNSNLSAWKVWYCLDNDTSRFAWADDSEDFSIPNTIKVSNGLYIRDVNSDKTYNNNQYYAWNYSLNVEDATIYYTLSENPEINDVTYQWKIDKWSHIYTMQQQTEKVSAVTSGHEGRAKEAIITYYNNELYTLKRDTTTNNGVIIDNGITYYTWVQEGNLNSNVYTLSECPEVGDLLYHYVIVGFGSMQLQQFAEVSSYQPPIHYYNGRGVIYRLIDEFNNDCPYDFKNIQFKRWVITALTSGSDEMKAALIYDADENPVYFGAKAYDSPVISGATLDDDNYIFAYTFDGALKDAEGNITHYDVSAAPFVGPQEFIDYMIEQEMGEGIADVCYDNFIGNYGEMDIEGDNLAPGLTLPNNVFFNSSYCYFYEDEDYWSYAFANCYGNSLKSYCSNNTFGNNCARNTFGNGCLRNTFGNSFYANTFGNYCTDSTFGNDCGNNTFGNSCLRNTFGNDCGNNTFGNNCARNTFGNSCQNNTFGNYCSTNTFGNNAEKCSVGDGVQNITVSKDFMRYVIIENGNQKITITSNKTTSSSAYLQNFLIALGVNNSNTAKTISHDSVNDAFRTVYQNENSTSVNV